MGVDLTVIIDRYPDQKNPLAYERIRFSRHRALWDVLRSYPSRPLPPNELLWWYRDEGIEKLRDDPYGDELRYTVPVTFERFDKKHPELWSEMSSDNQALIFYLSCLSPQTRLWLWWH